MVRHGTARQKLCVYKTEEALQVEPRSNSNFYGSARRGTTYKTGLRHEHKFLSQLQHFTSNTYALFTLQVKPVWLNQVIEWSLLIGQSNKSNAFDWLESNLV